MTIFDSFFENMDDAPDSATIGVDFTKTHPVFDLSRSRVKIAINELIEQSLNFASRRPKDWREGRV